MCQILYVKICGLNTTEEIGFDDVGEYDRATRSLHLPTVRWRVDPKTLVGQKLTLKGCYQDDGANFVNDMILKQGASNYMNCWFQSSRT